mmetsp:Transcript_27259/g.71866  ORF Transcript_27259/g.71866 Transcript_27259/m.71866 type:complete len:362 (-) Transcript_27259:96-1181(-)
MNKLLGQACIIVVQFAHLLAQPCLLHGKGLSLNLVIGKLLLVLLHCLDNALDHLIVGAVRMGLRRLELVQLLHPGFLGRGQSTRELRGRRLLGSGRENQIRIILGHSFLRPLTTVSSNLLSSRNLVQEISFLGKVLLELGIDNRLILLKLHVVSGILGVFRLCDVDSFLGLFGAHCLELALTGIGNSFGMNSDLLGNGRFTHLGSCSTSSSLSLFKLPFLGLSHSALEPHFIEFSSILGSLCGSSLSAHSEGSQNSFTFPLQLALLGQEALQLSLRDIRMGIERQESVEAGRNLRHRNCSKRWCGHERPNLAVDRMIHRLFKPPKQITRKLIKCRGLFELLCARLGQKLIVMRIVRSEENG